MYQNSIKDLDQTQWVCYEFPDGSIYYGYVAYLDDQDNIHPKDSVEMASNPKATLVKHGFGVYVYSVSGGTATCKYEGHWYKDKKSKTGKLLYSDGSIYTGGWKDGLRNDNGKMVWKSGFTYEGNWRRDRLEGAGTFRHPDGLELKGLFRCNYFIDGDILRNPFLNVDESESFMKARKDVLKLKEKIGKMKLGYFKRIQHTDYKQISELVHQSNKNNRVALLFPEVSCPATLSDFIKNYSEQTGYKIGQFDLRKAYTTPIEQKEVRAEQTGKELCYTIKEGGLYLINLDESDCEFKYVYYPDIRQFYNSGSLPSQIWSSKDMSKQEVLSHIGDATPNERFSTAVWTKHRISDNKSNDKVVMEALEKRFDTVLPLIKIDFILLTN